ncbi:MAG: hypothetical protein KF799_10905 [Bdellovibrionales bacterium]|nr:hypothetical protein [Bdellovibrionales bacterium]
MKLTWALALLSAFSVSTFAQNKPLFPVLACPAVGDEFEKMISKLDSIKTSIREDANCRNVQLKVDDLQKLVTDDRQRIMDIVGNAQGAPLSADQTLAVKNYAESVTKKVAALNDLFSQSNYCFKDDNPDNQLSSLAGFVGEAANLVGSVSGPWGTPIALAGNVIAGFMTGLDQIFKSRAGYDFDKSEQWVSYVQSLCTYHGYREQIEHLLNPKGRLAQLQSLKNKLDFQIEVMGRDCSDCREIMDTYSAHPGASPDSLTDQLAAQIAKANNSNAKPYGSYMLQSLGLRDWATSEMKRVQKESASYWSDAAGRHLLTKAKNDIEEFLIGKQGAKFLSHGVSNARTDYSNFMFTVGREGRQVYASMVRNHRELLNGRVDGVAWSSPIELFRALIIEPLDWNLLPASQQRDELQFVWTHFRDQSLDSLRTSVASTQMVQSFCSFFKHSGFYSPAIRSQCNGIYFKRQIEDQNALMSELIEANIDMGPLNGTFKAENEAVEESLTPIDAILKEIEIRAIGK